MVICKYGIFQMFKAWLLFVGVLALHTLVLGQILQYTLPPVNRVPVKPVMVNLITLSPPPAVISSSAVSKVVKPMEKPRSSVAKSYSKSVPVAKQGLSGAITEVKTRTAVKKPARLKPVREVPTVVKKVSLLKPAQEVSPAKVAKSKKLEKISPVSERPVASSAKVKTDVQVTVRKSSSTLVSKSGPLLPRVTESLSSSVMAVSKGVRGEKGGKMGDGTTSLVASPKTFTTVSSAPNPGDNSASKAKERVTGEGKGREVIKAAPGIQEVKRELRNVTVAPSYGAVYLRNPGPAYPEWSLRRGEEGRVWLRVQVTPTGEAAVVQIKESSGYSRLDEAAKETVGRWRFIPAQKDGVPVTDWVVVPVVFKLN